MRTNRMAIGLSVLNLFLLVLLLGNRLPSKAVAAGTTAVQVASPGTQEVVPVLRGRALEIVDEGGQIRSRINIEEDGEVVFRLRDRTGTIRVKMGAGEGGSGMVLLDEKTEPAVHMVARRVASSSKEKTTSITLRGAGDRQKVMAP